MELFGISLCINCEKCGMFVHCFLGGIWTLFSVAVFPVVRLPSWIHNLNVLFYFPGNYMRCVTCKGKCVLHSLLVFASFLILMHRNDVNLNNTS